jgi:hypothetical protein
MLPARIRVFDIPELVEAILVHLPPRDLLLSQRISRTFQTAIKSSPRLQQTLFFRPIPVKGPGDWTLNPLLRNPFLPWFVILESRWQLPDYETFELLDCNANEQKRAAFMHPNASWRRMLVIQPPPQYLRITESCHGQGGDSTAMAKVSFADRGVNGVTMDALYDIALEFTGWRRVSQFSILVHELRIGAPEIEMLLLYTQQCGGDGPRRGGHLMSQSKNVWNYNKVEFGRDPGPSSRPRRRNDEHHTDLLPKKGGVASHEFEKWKRERVPLSSLMSDVR